MCLARQASIKCLCVQARAEALGKDISEDMKAQLQEAYKKLGYHRLSDAAKEI